MRQDERAAVAVSSFFVAHFFDMRQRLNVLEQMLVRRRMAREAAAGRARAWAEVERSLRIQNAALMLEVEE